MRKIIINEQKRQKSSEIQKKVNLQINKKHKLNLHSPKTNGKHYNLQKVKHKAQTARSIFYNIFSTTRKAKIKKRKRKEKMKKKINGK